MARGGKTREHDADPERRCIVTRETSPKHGLVRFVVGPDGMVVFDLAEKLPGRGIWVTSDRDTIRQAVAKNAFTRAAQQPVSLPDGLEDLIERSLARRVIDLISLARKAGRAVSGYEKVKGWLLTENVRALIQASDGSGRGKSKLSTPEGARYIGCLTADELGAAFGRETTIHAALTGGGLTNRVILDAARLAGLRDNRGATAPERTNTSHERH
jgi:predicted RNA-binding protein YlxR (DUF448 family)